jgi:uncharacterized protein (TIGR02996 family)
MDLLAALLDACRERPEDDLPRRVLGDWMMDQPDAAAQARGEFIHLQLDIAAGKNGGQKRHDELLAAHQEEWLGSLLEMDPTFNRGLITVLASGSSEESELPRLLSHAPPPQWAWVDRLQLRSVSRRHLSRLGDWGGLATVSDLRIQAPNLTEGPVDWWKGLTQSPHFRPRVLHFRECGLLQWTLATLRVPVLVLHACWITDADILRLRDAPLWPHLRRLALPDNHLHAEAAEALATCPGLKGLKSLNLGRNVIGAVGARFLGHATHLDALEELDLRLNGIRDEGAAELYRSPLGRRLRRLNLVSNGVLSPQVQGRWRERLGDGVEL